MCTLRKFTLPALALFALACDGPSPVTTAETIEQRLETIRAQAEADGGGAVIVSVDEDTELFIADAGSPLYGTQVSIPAGALPEGVDQAVFSLVPILPSSAAPAVLAETAAAPATDTERPSMRLRMETKAGKPLGELRKPVTVSEPLPPSRSQTLLGAMKTAGDREGMCAVLQEEEKFRQKWGGVDVPDQTKKKELQKDSKTLLQKSRELLTTLPTKKEVKKDIDLLDGTRKELSDGQSELTLDEALQKQQQTFQMLTNITKMLHSTAMEIIRKMGTAPGLASPSVACSESEETAAVAERLLKVFPPVYVVETRWMGALRPLAREVKFAPEFELQVVVDGVEQCATTTVANADASFSAPFTEYRSIDVLVNQGTEHPALEMMVMHDPASPPAAGESLLLQGGPGLEASAGIACGAEVYGVDWMNAELLLRISEWAASGAPTQAACTSGSGTCTTTTGSARVELTLEAPLLLEVGEGSVFVLFRKTIDGFTWEN